MFTSTQLRWVGRGVRRVISCNSMCNPRMHSGKPPKKIRTYVRTLCMATHYIPHLCVCRYITCHHMTYVLIKRMKQTIWSAVSERFCRSTMIKFVSQTCFWWGNSVSSALMVTIWKHPKTSTDVLISFLRKYCTVFSLTPSTFNFSLTT